MIGVSGDDNIADALIKVLPGPVFERYKGYMGMVQRSVEERKPRKAGIRA